MPDNEHQDDPAYFERTDTLTQFEDFVQNAVLLNMYPEKHDEADDAEPAAA